MTSGSFLEVMHNVDSAAITWVSTESVTLKFINVSCILNRTEEEEWLSQLPDICVVEYYATIFKQCFVTDEVLTIVINCLMILILLKNEEVCIFIERKI